MATRPVHRTIPAVEALEVRSLPSANGLLPPAAPICPAPGNVTQQSGTPAGVSVQGPLLPPVGVDLIHRVPGHHKTVPLKPIHHGQHFQTALGAVFHVGGTGGLSPGDTAGGGQGQNPPGMFFDQDSPQDRKKKEAETANTWADTALKLEDLARKFEEDSDKVQKAADGLPAGPAKDALNQTARLYKSMADTFHQLAAEAGRKAMGK